MAIRFINVTDLSEEYASKLREWRNQEHVRSKMFNQNIISSEDHARFLHSLKENKNKKVYVAFIDDRPFGSFWFEVFDDWNNLELSYYLIDEELLNSGLGIVLEYVMLNHAFYDLKAHKVFCRTLTYNKKVVDLHTKFGFATEGVLKEQVKLKDGYADICFQGIFLPDWEGNRVRIEKMINTLVGIQNIGSL